MIKLIKKDDVLKEPIFKADNQVNPKINSRSFSYIMNFF
jgi:hypothetical protein